MAFKLVKVRVWPPCIYCDYDEFLGKHQQGCLSDPKSMFENVLVPTRGPPESRWVYDYITVPA